MTLQTRAGDLQRLSGEQGAAALAKRGTRVIDAKGRTLAPGFIDMHSHSDMPLVTDGNAPSKIRQGVQMAQKERSTWTKYCGRM